MADSGSWPWRAYQPLRLIYQLYTISAILARFPIWLIKFGLFRSLRPHAQWTTKQAIMAHFIRRVANSKSQIGITESLSLKPGPEKERFQVIQPFPTNLYAGPLSSSSVAPTTIGGTWYPKLKSGQDIGPNGSVILHIHGGAFVEGDGRTAGYGFLANTLIEYAGADAVFQPQYRLSGYGRENPFPAALQDVLTSYLYLLRTIGIPARNIVVSGDSAGGNLAIAFLRWLSDYGKDVDVPNPGSAVLLSPWVSPQNSAGPEITFLTNPNYDTDFLPYEFTRWGAETYSAITPVSDPYITALGNSFATPVPIFVNQGSVEILEIDGSLWVQEMVRVEGNRIESNYEAGAPHDTLLVGGYSGWAESAQAVADKIGRFIKAAQSERSAESENIPGKL